MHKKLEHQNQSEQSSNARAEEEPAGNPDLFRTMNADEWRRIQAEFLSEQALRESQRKSEKPLSFTDLPLEEMVSGVTAQEKDSTEENWSPDPFPSSKLAQSAAYDERDSDEALSHSTSFIDVGYTLNQKYKLVQLLGEGITGRVFLAQHLHWRTRYVIKILHPWISRQNSAMQQFIKSFQELETFQHEGIVRPFLLDYDPPSGRVFYFMDYIEGETLVSSLLRKHNQGDDSQFSKEDVLYLFEALVSIITYTHSHSFYAGNIQPSRILLTPNGHAPLQLLSYGLSFATQGSSPLQSGSLHTMYYAAPELKMGNPTVTGACDVFSIGVMVYQLLTGTLPIGIPRPPSEVSSQWPKSLDHVMACAMHAEPGQRYDSLRVFLDEFKSAFKPRSNMVQLSLSGEEPPLTAPVSQTFQPTVASPPPFSHGSKQSSVVSQHQPGKAKAPSSRLANLSKPSTPLGDSHQRNASASRVSSLKSDGASRLAVGQHSSSRSHGISPHSPHPNYGSQTPPSIYGSQTSSSISMSHAGNSRIVNSVMGSSGTPSPGEPISTWPAHEHRITSMALSPDGKLLASTGEEGCLRLWATGSWSQLQTLPIEGTRISQLRWSSDSRYVAFVCDSLSVQVWDTRHMRKEQELSHQSKVHDLAWHTKGHLLYTACADQQIHSWNLRLQRINGTLEGHEGAVRALLFDPKSKMLVSGGDDSHIKMWSVERKKLFQNLSFTTASISAMTLSHSSNMLATGHADNVIQVRDLRTGHLKCSLTGHEGTITCLSFGPNDRWLASGSMDGTLRIWDSREYKLIHTIGHHNSPVHSIGVSNDGQWIASASNENTICIWDSSRW